ncbi:MAG: hypothetical protein A2312_02675 [Candidatus Staskawiczbacteria bacterium RIFOXYB2_FULL_32_9]|uniref:Four helix bundle protein n=1 Tax=Candidatus Staskawiczbacteria bacterium RIFOXYD1_FULL_32_13 TaxID=1802234 RepID=A0A1G2JLK3_9BACT|nr:MAG: hypothetical protein A2256_02935 [Candidatus Staskawiczbacteria bacterium RIFOXYA2_FULL_32_7]OGZ80880.1 MAG: hypothetical protein A2360_04290 [Candidatus Staskawiczbacteria bacterium RIFOXYB1_FULL_32_11]OGZ84271.1 MAG: hypothetical protein A2312_02675 [Candidatus Staskawiczbacteria bacterium RIFOXYB2_FULL_32_9]OGZ85866.1 MAG: hypothetical protein A2463_03230 [Candidatus Staskawiczbacteria bacterium RIFOXYC2_FULL_32_10]OGZ88015.1 MAG: hypothetical protein A2561_02915 [Candidatus Staskawi
MAEFFNHNQNNFHLIPPPRLLPVLDKAKTSYKNWLSVHRNIERTARFGLGLKVDNLFLDLLELLRKAVFTPIDKKVLVLQLVSDKIDVLRFFIQILWESKLISNNQYILLETDINEIGRSVGGWKKGLISKTSAFKTEERKQ